MIEDSHNHSDLLHIVVSDTGVGISKDIQERLFKPYQTFSHQGVDNKNGVGLGLSICKMLARSIGPKE